MKKSDVQNVVCEYLNAFSPLPANDPLGCAYLEIEIIDSLGIIEMVLNFEDKFGVQFSARHLQSPEFRTVGGVCDIIWRLMQESQSSTTKNEINSTSPEKNMRVVDDLVILPTNSGNFILYNPHTRTTLGVDIEGIRCLSNHFFAPKDSAVNIWDIDHFGNSDGLLANPNCFLSVEKWPQARQINRKQFQDICEQRYFFVTDIVEYNRHLQRRLNLHQQLGQVLHIDTRKDPKKWWLEQKFTSDLSAVKNNLYGAIQQNYLNSYIPKKFSTGDIVYDLGCGIGLYAEQIAATGAKVHGIDPNQEYISIAQRRGESTAEFSVAPIGSAGALNHLADASADYVFLCDMLLFYFVPPSVENHANMEVLLADIKRILKPSGKIICFEPHYNYWLQPWLGSSTRPYTLISEYMNRSYRVTPTISEFVQKFSRAGFVVSWMDELLPDPAYNNVDERGFNFASEFPLWHLFELQRMKE